MSNQNFDSIMYEYINCVTPYHIGKKIEQVYEANDYEALRLLANFFIELDEPGISDSSIILSLGKTIRGGKKTNFYPIIEIISNGYINNGVFLSLKYEKFLYGWMSLADLTLILDKRLMNNIEFSFNYLQIFTNIIVTGDIFEHVVGTPEFLALRKGLVESGKIRDVEDILQFPYNDRYNMNKFYDGLPGDYQLGIAI